MGAIAAMVRKDLLRKLRSPLGLLVVLAFPIVFAAIIGVTFGGGNEPPRVRLLVENLDDGPAGNALLSALTSNQAAEYFDVEVVEENGRERIERGEASALLRVPESFSQDLIEGNPVTLQLVRNPAEGILPEIAEQVVGVLAEVLDGGVHVLRKPLDELAPFTRDTGLRITDDTVAGVAVAIKGAVEGAERYLSPPAIEIDGVSLEDDAADEEGGGGAGAVFSVFLLVFPGVSVYALFLVGDLGMRDLLGEFDAGTLRRQMTGPVTANTIVLAKAAFTAGITLLGLLILTVAGAFFRDRPIDVAAFLLVSLSLILAVTGAGAAVYGASGSQQRGATVASVIYLVLAFAGGSFFRLEQMPGLLRAVAPVSPFYWGTEGYRALLERDAGIAEVWPSVAVLSTLGVVLLAVGSRLLHRRVLRGGA